MMNLKKFVEACNELPNICGWTAGVVELEESEENRVYVACDIHHTATDPGSLYTDLWHIVNQATSLFGSTNTTSEVIENGEEKEASPYRLILEVKYKRTEKTTIDTSEVRSKEEN